MRLDFQNSAGTQDPVTSAQVQMRQATPRKVPVLRLLLLIVLAIVIAYAAWYFLRAGTTYSYGLASANTTPYHAPYEGIVEGLTLERGDRVTQGQVLFKLRPEPSEKVEEAKAALLGQLEEARGEEARRLERRTELARKEVERLEQIYNEEVARKEHSMRAARIELEKVSGVYQSRQRRADQVSELFEMDAAVRSDVEAAEEAARLAHYNLRQTESNVARLEQQAIPSKPNLDKARIELEQAEEEQASTPSELERSKFELAFAESEPSPIEVIALSDGVVLEVVATNGNRVVPYRNVVSVADAGHVWVDAYISPARAKRLDAGAPALVYPPGETEPIRGTIAEDSGAAVKVPELIRDKLPSLRTAVYVRIVIPESEAARILPGTPVKVVIPNT